MRHEFATVFKEALQEPRRGELLRRPVRAEWLAGALVLYLGLSQLLLWRFLDVMPAGGYALGALLVCTLSFGVVTTVRRQASMRHPSLATVLVCLAFAAGLFVLGGEGRIFYSNMDWQVRDAVLRDMSIHSWPFVYTARAQPDVLRAPLGMYFVPALIFKAFGARAADAAMLLQNSLLLGTVLALASTLLDNVRQRVVTLTVFVVFSGLDALGEIATHRFFEHLDGWAGIQFSSTITLAFWVPQHALAGWIAAVAYLLWRTGRSPPSLLLTLVPLTALWSPLSAIGSLPFVAIAGLTTVIRRQLRTSDVLLPAGSVILSVPGLLYMGAADGSVGLGLLHFLPGQYLLFESLEALPYLVPLAYAAVRFVDDRDTVAVAALCLLAAPLIRIGYSVDFTMRASIPALALVAFLTAKLLLQPPEKDLGLMKAMLIGALVIGAATGGSEILRAVSHPPAPRGTCSFFKAWDQSFGDFPKDSYLAPLDSMPSLVRPSAPERVASREPARCWPGVWYRPGLL